MFSFQCLCVYVCMYDNCHITISMCVSLYLSVCLCFFTLLFFSLLVNLCDSSLLFFCLFVFKSLFLLNEDINKTKLIWVFIKIMTMKNKWFIFFYQFVYIKNNDRNVLGKTTAGFSLKINLFIDQKTQIILI